MGGTNPPVPSRASKPITTARIGLGRAGAGLKTSDMLAFDLACAQARDAVATTLDIPALTAALAPLDCVAVHSAANGRPAYLRRPDLGRRLDPASACKLPACSPDLVIVLADGLSSRATENHGPPVAKEILARVPDLRVGPLVIAEQARIAIADEIGELMNARCAVILIGERPGLSTPDSLGLYFTYAPKRGRTDAEKNCISNVHGNGLRYDAAADQLVRLLRQSFELKLSGLKLNQDDSVRWIDGKPA